MSITVDKVYNCQQNNMVKSEKILYLSLFFIYIGIICWLFALYYP